MAFMQCIGGCINCGRLFHFNPERVPSITVNGQREPVCAACMDNANAKRKFLGLPPWPILPGAYDAEEVE